MYKEIYLRVLVFFCGGCMCLTIYPSNQAQQCVGVHTKKS